MQIINLSALFKVFLQSNTIRLGKRTTQSEFHTANALIRNNEPMEEDEEQEDIAMALDNLALAATNDRDQMAMLIKTNNTLTQTNKNLSEKITDIQMTLQSIEKK